MRFHTHGMGAESRVSRLLLESGSGVSGSGVSGSGVSGSGVSGSGVSGFEGSALGRSSVRAPRARASLGLSLWLYLVRRFFFKVLLSAGFLFLIHLIGDGTELFNRVSKVSQDYSFVLVLMFYKSWGSLNSVLPFALVLAGVSVVIGLGRRSELAVMRAAGLSALSLLWPLGLVGFVVGVVSVAFLNPVATVTEARYITMLDTILAGGTREEAYQRARADNLRARNVWLRLPREGGFSIVHMARVSGAQIERLSMIETDHENQLMGEIFAERANFEDNQFTLREKIRYWKWLEAGLEVSSGSGGGKGEGKGGGTGEGVESTGVVDTGVVDTGAVGTGAVDTGVVDTGVVDIDAMVGVSSASVASVASVASARARGVDSAEVSRFANGFDHELSPPVVLARAIHVEMIRLQQLRADRISIYKLPLLIGSLRERGMFVVPYRVQLAMLLSLPFMFGLLTLMAAAFALGVRPRSSYARALIGALLCGIALVFAARFFVVQGSLGVLPVWVVALTPSWLTLLVIVLALQNSEKN